MVLKICSTCKRTYQPGQPCHPRQAEPGKRRRKSSRYSNYNNPVGGGHHRRDYYNSAWRKHSKARRAEQPWCSVCGTDTSLTVDHPTDAVLCRRCHGRLEQQRLNMRQADKQRKAKANAVSAIDKHMGKAR